MLEGRQPIQMLSACAAESGTTKHTRAAIKVRQAGQFFTNIEFSSSKDANRPIEHADAQIFGDCSRLLGDWTQDA